jgi:hypothetical protein
MDDKFQKFTSALAIAALGFLLMFAKKCAKNADLFVKKIDIPAVNMGPDSPTFIRAGTKAGRTIVKNYLNEDSTQYGVNIETWNDRDLANFILIDLGLIASKVADFKIEDTTYSNRIIRNFDWLNKYSGLSFDELEKITTDSLNKDMQNGSKYFLRLVIANSFLENKSSLDLIILNDDDLKTRLIKPLLLLKKIKGKNRKIIKNHWFKIAEEIFKILYYPFHKEIAIKTYNDIIFAKDTNSTFVEIKKPNAQ